MRDLTIDHLISGFYKWLRPARLEFQYLEDRVGQYITGFATPPLPELDRAEVIKRICTRIRTRSAGKAAKTRARTRTQAKQWTLDLKTRGGP